MDFVVRFVESLFGVLGHACWCAWVVASMVAPWVIGIAGIGIVLFVLFNTFHAWAFLIIVGAVFAFFTLANM